MLAEIVKREAGHLGVARVFPHQDLAVTLHAAREAQQHVQGPAHPLRQVCVTHRRQNEADREVAAPHSHVA